MTRSRQPAAHDPEDLVGAFLDQLIAFAVGPCRAGLSDAVARGAAGGGAGAGLADPGLDHHPGAERAGAGRRAAALAGAGRGRARRDARRRAGLLGRTSRAARRSWRPGRCRAIRGWWRGARRSSCATARSRCSSPASCRRSAPSCRSPPARSAWRRRASSRSISRRSCCGRRRMCCPACMAGHELEKAGGLRLHHGLPVLAGVAALVVVGGVGDLAPAAERAAQPGSSGLKRRWPYAPRTTVLR